MAIEVVTDTNVIAYLLIQTPLFTHEVERFWQRGIQAAAPAHWEAELANALWVTLRANLLSPERASALLALGSQLPMTTVAVSDLWQGALSLSQASGVAVYDTLFVELAMRRNCRLATFDKAVLHAFPDIAARPRDLL